MISRAKGLVVVVLVSPTFHPDADVVELHRHHDGWSLSFVRPYGRNYQLFTKNEVGEDIGERAVKNEGNVVRYMESCLRSVGYEGLNRRSTAIGVDIVAVWDVTSPDGHSESRASGAPSALRPRCPRCGHDLTSSLMKPQGTDAAGVLYEAKFCSREALLFGRACDGSWTVPLRP
jgi:hypothetical protein